jgi:lipopolysaccharide biosynthesis protein
MSLDENPKLIAFYLPQFHPIPENDAWWGRGFTEWTNVTRAKPLFKGHHQPHLPADLGFYDLRLAETRQAQADMAREYGLHGFCYYHYWFNGHELLERPFDEVLASGEPDFPFCLCWANENWSRRWDGREEEVLIAQDYSAYDPHAHLKKLLPAFADPRYIKIDQRPFFAVYWPDHIPNLEEVTESWRKTAWENGIAGLYLCAVRSHRSCWSGKDARQHGFDAIIDFEPHPLTMPQKLSAGRLRRLWSMLWNRVAGKEVVRSCVRFDYAEIVQRALQRQGDGVRHPCVFPSWDNVSRRKNGGRVMQNTDPKLYANWLKAAIQSARQNPVNERFVFINAWNEWAEGCHLEPDLLCGKRFLEATKAAIGSDKACQDCSSL